MDLPVLTKGPRVRTFSPKVRTGCNTWYVLQNRGEVQLPHLLSFPLPTLSPLYLRSLRNTVLYTEDDLSARDNLGGRHNGAFANVLSQQVSVFGRYLPSAPPLSSYQDFVFRNCVWKQRGIHDRPTYQAQHTDMPRVDLQNTPKEM